MSHCHHALIGEDNEEIINNFERVKDLGLYENVTDQYGQLARYSYGMRDFRELFASLRYNIT